MDIGSSGTRNIKEEPCFSQSNALQQKTVTSENFELALGFTDCSCEVKGRNMTKMCPKKLNIKYDNELQIYHYDWYI